LDITATVDWTHVKRAGERAGFDVVEFSAQDKFLLQAGLLEELERQTNAATSDAEKLRLATSAREMILPGGMASSFQVLVQKRRPTQ
jgi:SAM-dependent MidA family methyltransferase